MGLTCSRAVASNRDVIDKYYSTLEDTLIANKHLHSPGSKKEKEVKAKGKDYLYFVISY